MAGQLFATHGKALGRAANPFQGGTAILGIYSVNLDGRGGPGPASGC
jgi:hypothetical protein